MHNAAFAALNLNWAYLAFEVDPKNLRAAIDGARAMNFTGLNLTVPHKLLAVDLVLNATSLGLRADDAMPLDDGRFPLGKVGAVYDMIYRPAETKLLGAARRAGCRTANGLGMLLYQGARAFEIWTEKAAPLEVMRQALERNVYGH